MSSVGTITCGAAVPFWQHFVPREFEALEKAIDGCFPTLLGPYGGTNLAEFFALVTVAFFELAPLVPDEQLLLKNCYR